MLVENKLIQAVAVVMLLYDILSYVTLIPISISIYCCAFVKEKLIVGNDFASAKTLVRSRPPPRTCYLQEGLFAHHSRIRLMLGSYVSIA